MYWYNSFVEKGLENILKYSKYNGDYFLTTPKILTCNQMKVSDFIVNYLSKTDKVFVQGGSIIHIADSIDRAKIKFIPYRMNRLPL